MAGLRAAARLNQAFLPCRSRQTGIHTVIITGGNSGLGHACARRLAQAGWHVVIAARDAEKSAQAVQRISATSGGAIEALALDLGSLRDIRRFTQHFAQSGHSLHALVCNAGVQNGTLGARTADGHEQTFGINHLGHFLLVNLLLPRLAAGGRIVTVSSAAHDPARRTGLPRPRLTDARLMAHPETDPELDTDPALAARRAYATSKLCNLLFTHELARRLATSGNAITVNAFDPGFMPGTALSRSMTPMPRFLFQHLLAPLGRLLPGITSPEQSGAGLARLVEDPALTRVNGGYFTGSGAATPSIESRNVEKAAVLWRQSAELVGLTPEAG